MVLSLLVWGIFMVLWGIAFVVFCRPIGIFLCNAVRAHYGRNDRSPGPTFNIFIAFAGGIVVIIMGVTNIVNAL